jgi:hypothetical protein
MEVCSPTLAITELLQVDLLHQNPRSSNSLVAQWVPQSSSKLQELSISQAPQFITLILANLLAQPTSLLANLVHCPDLKSAVVNLNLTQIVSTNDKLA